MRTVWRLLDFAPEDDTEIPLKDGEVVELIEDMGDGWSNVRNEQGKAGFVPSQWLFPVP